MCGIAGIISKSKPIDRNILVRMADSLAHRGPDDSGEWIRREIPNTGFSHRRLSIIDLSDAGHQPMSTPDKALTITYNGEIYNYIELRDELLSLGSVFQGNSDTEVLLEAYRHWGTECLSKLNGMFAFAIWDENKKRMFAARDRFGQKPFFYFKNSNLFAFASEMKALFQIPEIPCSPDSDTINSYLSKFDVNRSERTFFENISSLSPANAFIIDEDLTFNQWQYWKIEDRQMREEESIDVFRDLLFDSIKIRMRRMSHSAQAFREAWIHHRLSVSWRNLRKGKPEAP